MLALPLAPHLPARPIELCPLPVHPTLVHLFASLVRASPLYVLLNAHSMLTRTTRTCKVPQRSPDS